jgi:hypothetical protein
VRTIDVPELGCRAIVVDCEDEQLLLLDAGLDATERADVMRDVLAAT